MWLRNFYNLLAWMIMGKHTSTSNFDDENISLKNISGSFSSTVMTSSNFHFFYPQGGNNYNNFYQDTSGNMGKLNYGFIFGSGDTEVTYDDYKLVSPITNSCSMTNAVFGTPTYNADTKTWSTTVQYDIKNTDSTSVTIKEIGIKNSSNVLLYREVLDEPITLDVGITMVYTHTFKFTMPII